MRHLTTKALFDYWNEVRQNRLAPHRFDIEPGRIAQHLPDALILERESAEEFRFRLAGTRLCEHFGATLRGKRLCEIFSPDETRLLSSNLSVMARQGAVGLFHVQSSAEDGCDGVAELLLMPLLHTQKSVDRYLGAWSFEDALTKHAGVPFSHHSILDYELIWPRGRPSFSCHLPRHDPPTVTEFRHSRIVRSDRRHFRVYEGGKQD
jgi:hypothetical protein